MLGTQDIANENRTLNLASDLAKCYSEALSDSRSLQALASDLLSTLLLTQRELTEAQLVDSQTNRIDMLCTLGK